MESEETSKEDIEVMLQRMWKFWSTDVEQVEEAN